MDEAAWKAMVAHYDRVSKKLDHKKAERSFLRNVDAALTAIPEVERVMLQSYWQSAKEATHPFDGTKHPAPLFLTDTNFMANSIHERASGLMASEGCCFVFEARLIYTAPGEVVQALIAHELAHALIYAKYHNQNLPLPALNFPRDLSELQEYPEHKRHEEYLVNEFVTKWGFVQYYLEFWELALEDAPDDPRNHYSMLKRTAKKYPATLGIKPSRGL